MLTPQQVCTLINLYIQSILFHVVQRINNTFRRADQIQWSNGIGPQHKDYIDFSFPLWLMLKQVFWWRINAFELMKAMIEAGAAGCSRKIS